NTPLSRFDPRNTDVVSDDAVVMSLQYSTQWDSFAHVGSEFDADGDGRDEIVYYNGYRAHEHVLGPGAALPEGQASFPRPLGAHHFARLGVQGRGVLVDLHAHVGTARVPIGYDRLMEVLAADGVTVETGDLVLLHTG